MEAGVPAEAVAALMPTMVSAAVPATAMWAAVLLNFMLAFRCCAGFIDHSRPRAECGGRPGTMLPSRDRHLSSDLGKSRVGAVGACLSP
ncbi:hypothetical protein GCM10010361_41280 [Streptomyces olivaceiscleroticus]|uniref:Secreted protein n=1 Tax=Streptomyces olivaceiscleroticus TaxID=68245 RepID=A0ABP3K6S0_9ACTN